MDQECFTAYMSINIYLSTCTNVLFLSVLTFTTYIHVHVITFAIVCRLYLQPAWFPFHF